MTDFLFNLIVLIILLDFLLESFLDHKNYQNWSSEMPDALKDFYTPSKYVRAFFYNQHKYLLSAITRSFSILVLFFMIVLGGFDYIDSISRNISGESIITSVLFFIILFAGNQILMIPFQAYSTFIIENKYGFNRTKIPLFIKDNIISFILLSILIAATVSIIIFLYELMGKNAWFLIWIIFTVFLLLLQYYYTTLIVPLFNKLTLLKKDALREKIEAYAASINFPLENIYTMDASKRSSKANAFFSGFGKRKTIVLHDTLLENHSDEEIVSVIAHEAGHYKRKHTLQMFIVSGISSAIMLYLLFGFIDNQYASGAVGIGTSSFHGSILAFGILFGPVSFVLGTIGNIFSRKNEFEADEFAKNTSSGKDLALALKKFSIEHLSNLMPHKLYVFFYYTHPPVIERIQRM